MGPGLRPLILCRRLKPARALLWRVPRTPWIIHHGDHPLICHPEGGPAQECIKPALGLMRWLARVEGPAFHNLQRHRKTRQQQILRLRARPTRGPQRAPHLRAMGWRVAKTAGRKSRAVASLRMTA